ncbi:leguminosin group486 secreted peptide [Medicago truncatula]|uniref:S-protein homolog n=1 Tax=Medicago truncatula TaxID=3880 RepID=G7KMB5_MEDTR|nr:leguminosin group486 secreted peptide [Medicago truncatula]
MEPPLNNIDLNIPFNPESEEETDNDPEHYVEESEEEIEIVMFDEDQPQEVYDTNIADIEYDFEENVQHVDESEPEGVLNADGTDNGRKFLSNEERKAIAHLLLQHSHAGRLKKGTRKLIASIQKGHLYELRPYITRSISYSITHSIVQFVDGKIDGYYTIYEHIINNMTNTALGVRCKDKNHDAGFRRINFQEVYTFSFKPNPIVRVTLWFCRFTWNNDFQYFDIYIQKRDYRSCTKDCTWFINRYGPCRLKGTSLDCFPWNPKFAIVYEHMQLGHENNTLNV